MPIEELRIPGTGGENDIPEGKFMSVMFTGPRDAGADPDEANGIIFSLSLLIRELAEEHGTATFITGGALGFDTLAAEAVLRAKKELSGISLRLILPCSGQDARWRGPDRERYRRIFASADETTVLSPRYYRGVMHVRNRAMADAADLCVAYLREGRPDGGTGYTAAYAAKRGIPVLDLSRAARFAPLSGSLPCLPVWVGGGTEAAGGQAGEPLSPNDEYADFFPVPAGGLFREGHSYSLRIACDTDYNIFINGKLAGFGQYSDFPGRAVYDEYRPDLRPGDSLLIRAWHSGINSLTHVRHRCAYAAFALYEDGVCLPEASSGPRTPSKRSDSYLHRRERVITSQTGAGFLCDGRRADRPAEEGCRPSVLSHAEISEVLPRPCRKLEAGEPVAASEVFRSRASFGCQADADPAVILSKAVFRGSGGDGLFVIFDLGRETVGFPEISFDAPAGGSVAYFGWGEHLTDGRCRTVIGGRRFGSAYLAHRGRNTFMPSLRRIGCRYVELFVTGQPENVRLRFIPAVYPVGELPSGMSPGSLRERIWETSVNTLRCCMHEHYEDCPWREQALYSLDSRNQMLAGYTVFEDGNRDMVKASLDLMSRGLRPDGMLPLCAPAGLDYPIPFFTLVYFIQFREYLDFSGDTAFASEKLPLLRRIMDGILARRHASGPLGGLVPRFPDSAGYWNFYEWSPGLSGNKYRYDESDPPAEAPFNAALALALRALAAICAACGEEAAASLCSHEADEVTAAVRRTFLRPDGFFDSFTDGPARGSDSARLSVLTQALCLLCGAADRGESERCGLCRTVASNGGTSPAETSPRHDGSAASSSAGPVPATLSMFCFRYDALLSADRDKYASVIIDEIDRTGRYMLERGATSFWETLRGEADFGGAGSLCHGWSAVFPHYYRLLSE